MPGGLPVKENRPMQVAVSLMSRSPVSHRGTRAYHRDIRRRFPTKSILRLRTADKQKRKAGNEPTQSV